MAGEQMTIFDFTSPPKYPDVPGWKARETSRQAAIAITPKAKPLRERVFDALKDRPGTPEDIAQRLGVPLMNVRPRCSELARKGRIFDTGRRRQAAGGKRAIVWGVS